MKRSFIFLFIVLKLNDYSVQELSIYKRNLHIPLLSPHGAIFGFLEADNKVFLILNYLLLLFKYYVYVSRRSKVLCFEVKESGERNRKLFTKHWKTILQNLQNFKKYEVLFL